MKPRFVIIWLILVAAAAGVYAVAFRPLVAEAYSGTAPDWFTYLIDAVYPRFRVEKQRFELDFFRQKADQVVFRLALVNGLAAAALLLRQYSGAFRRRLRLFWNISVPLSRITGIRILFFAGMLFFGYEWLHYLSELSAARAFYQPLPLFRLLGIPFPSREAAGVIYGIFLLSCLAAVVNLRPVLASTLAALTFILMQGWLYSFEKIDHTFATFTYAAMLMPFMLYQAERARQRGETESAGWPLQLICLSICLVYAQAGLEKLLIAGPAWLSAESFRGYLYLHPTPLSRWVAASAVLCVLLPVTALLLQLTFISIVLVPGSRWLILPAGWAFHAGTYELLGVGWYVGPWVIAYLFFIPWEKFRLDLWHRAWSKLPGPH
jgi:hypothetical protein